MPSVFWAVYRVPWCCPCRTCHLVEKVDNHHTITTMEWMLPTVVCGWVGRSLFPERGQGGRFDLIRVSGKAAVRRWPLSWHMQDRKERTRWRCRKGPSCRETSVYRVSVAGGYLVLTWNRNESRIAWAECNKDNERDGQKKKPDPMGALCWKLTLNTSSLIPRLRNHKSVLCREAT